MKRKISMLMCLVMAMGAASALSGCGGKESDTLVWYCIGDTPKDNAAVLAKANEIVEPAIGMKIDIQYIDAASFTEKMKLKMAARESYDLVFTGYVNQYQDAVNMGGLYDITELLEEVNMTEVIDEFYIEAAKVNGRVYGIPNRQVISNPPCIEIEKPIAEECGVSLAKVEEYATNATTTEDVQNVLNEMDSVLAKIHEKRPDLYATQSGLATLGILYEEIECGIGLRKDGTSDKLVIFDDTEESRISAEMTHKWYKEGYIRADIASAPTATTTDEKRQYAVRTGTWKPGQEQYFMDEYGTEPEYALLSKPYVARKGALMTMISVGADSKHPKEAVEFIKLINSNEELYNIICWGIEDVHYTLDEAGKVSEIKGSGYEGVGQNAWRYGNQFNGFVMVGQPDNVWEETEQMNTDAVKSPLLGFVPNLDSVSAEIANIANVQGEYTARKSYGTEPREKYFDEYKKKMNEAGQQRVLEVLQKQYEEFLANK